ncbi:MAG: polyprenyl synthetase family protein [Chitinophagales bacterium]
MASLDEIKKPIARELDLFEQRFRADMRTDAPLLDQVMHYIVSRKGKQMRPMFVFLSAALCGGIQEGTYTAASLIEILHTATLVHDDVVDDSYKRRGYLSINALWKNKIAVLVGDYLLARGLLISINNNQFVLLKIISNTIQEMSEGELLQLKKARKLDIDEQVYFEIIRKKTASLIASSCACGAATATADAGIVEKVRVLGETIGMAFQIKDDLFDYEEAEIGKPRGIDIKERKMTLPLIYTLQQVPASERRRLINMVKNENTDMEKVREIIDVVRRTGGIAYAEEKMRGFKQEAEQLLDEFPASEARTAIRELIAFTINRKV